MSWCRGSTIVGWSMTHRFAVLALVWLGLPAAALGQVEPGHPESPTGGAQLQEPGPVGNEYPSLHLSGFADVDFSAQRRSEGARGFSEGQFVLHLASALSPRVNVFGELSFTPRADAGSGTPATTGFNAEVERVIIRFDQSDLLKMSFGRYYTPVNWWFHPCPPRR